MVGASPTAVSRHLSKLRWAKLVRVRREGTFVVLLGGTVHDVARLLAEALYHADQQVFGLPDHPTDRPRLRDVPGDRGAAIARIPSASSLPVRRPRPVGTFVVASILVIACLVVIAVLIDTFLLNRRVRRRR